MADSMRLCGPDPLRPALVLLSGDLGDRLFAISSLADLSVIARRPRSLAAARKGGQRPADAAAISGMHYTAMAAAKALRPQAVAGTCPRLELSFHR